MLVKHVGKYWFPSQMYTETAVLLGLSYELSAVPLGSNSEVSLNHSSGGDIVSKVGCPLSVCILHSELLAGMDHIIQNPRLPPPHPHTYTQGLELAALPRIAEWKIEFGLDLWGT